MAGAGGAVLTMVRLVALNALLFLSPFLAYGIVIIARRGSLNDLANWPARVLIACGLIGAFVMGIGLIFLIDWSGASPDQTYRPATLVDGELVPGGFEDNE